MLRVTPLFTSSCLALAATLMTACGTTVTTDPASGADAHIGDGTAQTAMCPAVALPVDASQTYCGAHLAAQRVYPTTPFLRVAAIADCQLIALQAHAWARLDANRDLAQTEVLPSAVDGRLTSPVATTNGFALVAPHALGVEDGGYIGYYHASGVQSWQVVDPTVRDWLAVTAIGDDIVVLGVPTTGVGLVLQRRSNVGVTVWSTTLAGPAFAVGAPRQRLLALAADGTLLAAHPAAGGTWHVSANGADLGAGPFPSAAAGSVAGSAWTDELVALSGDRLAWRWGDKVGGHAETWLGVGPSLQKPSTKLPALVDCGGPQCADIRNDTRLGALPGGWGRLETHDCIGLTTCGAAHTAFIAQDFVTQKDVVLPLTSDQACPAGTTPPANGLAPVTASDWTWQGNGVGTVVGADGVGTASGTACKGGSQAWLGTVTLDLCL